MAQIPNYSEASYQVVSAQTKKKIQILEKKDPALAKIAQELFGWSGSAAGSIDTSLQGLDKVTRDRLQSIFSQEIALAQGITSSSGSAGTTVSGGTSTGGIADGIVSSIQGFTNRVDTSISNQIKNINEKFEPVSRELGQTLGNISRFTQDPLGTIALLPGSLKNVIERNFPGFASDVESFYKQFNIEALVNLPTQIAGNISSLVTGLDAILTLPVIIITDIYQGCLDIINAISDAIDQIVSSFVEKILTEFLDGLLLDILKVLEDISELASYVGGIATLSMGANSITQYTNLVQNYAGSLGSFINNPLDTLFAYAPPQISEGLYLLRNPQQLVNNLLPKELTQGFAKLASATGFGFNGNMGYGFVSVLQGLRGGVISSVLSNFSAQYPILTPLLGLLNSTSNMNATEPSVTAPSPVAPDNSYIQTGKQGSLVLQKDSPKVVPSKDDFAQMMGINTNPFGSLEASAIKPAPVTTTSSTPVINTQGSGLPINPSSRLGPTLTQ